MKREIFGKQKSGETIEIVTLSNADAEIKIMTRGATIVSFKPFGVHIAAGYDTLEDYEADTSTYFGATVGRVANRIADAQFTMDGAIYMVTGNDNGNCLHGGNGYSFRIWSIDEVTEDSVTMSYYSADGEEGFPAGLNVKVKFTLSGAAVIIEYEAIPEGKTPIALTNHSYFNLDGFGGVIDGQIATIYADRYTEVGEGLIPNGNRPLVEGTPFDFRSPKRIGEDFGKSVDGYDHNFILCPEISAEFNGKQLPLIATVTNGTLALNVYTDQPGVQFYTGNFLGGEPDIRGGIKKIKHGAFCLEAQTEPNCINHGIGFYDAGEVYRQTTVYEVKKV
ncbi:MAG: galactose mutarotase [Clostridia bacterium]|nr:galactose mutarotase [Clostridia bacterium]